MPTSIRECCHEPKVLPLLSEQVYRGTLLYIPGIFTLKGSLKAVSSGGNIEITLDRVENKVILNCCLYPTL